MFISNASVDSKFILDQLLVAFPWWVDLHGWWRTNPTYNTSFSTADPGQDFAAEAAGHFGTGKGKEIPPPMDDEDGADAENEELEPGQILDEGIHQGEGDDFPMDDTNDVPLLSHTNEDQDWPDWDDGDDSSGPSSRLPQVSSSNPSLVMQPTLSDF